MAFTTAMLGTALATALAGAATAGIGALSKDDDNKFKKELETMHTTKPGFSDLGEDMVDPVPDRFGLRSKTPSVIFPRMGFSNTPNGINNPNQGYNKFKL